MKEAAHKPVAEAARHVDGQHLWAQCGVQSPGRRRGRVHLSQGVADVELQIQLTGLCGDKCTSNSGKKKYKYKGTYRVVGVHCVASVSVSTHIGAQSAINILEEVQVLVCFIHKCQESVS